VFLLRGNSASEIGETPKEPWVVKMPTKTLASASEAEVVLSQTAEMGRLLRFSRNGTLS
jgi:hypothetical protein